MKTKILTSSEILSSLRFDSSYHLSNSIIYEKIIKSKTYLPLSELVSEIFTAGRSKRVYVSNLELGYPYLSNSDVISQSPLSNCKYVSKKYSFDDKSFLKEGMIITGRVGAIGQTAYVSAELEQEKAMGSDNIIRIVPKESTLSGYLYTYLVSRYGNTFFWKIASGGVQPYISEPAIYELPVPILRDSLQLQIHNLIIEAERLRIIGNKLIVESEESFKNELQIDRDTYKKLISDSEKSYNNYFSIVKNSNLLHSFRARNHSIRKGKIVDLFNSVKSEKLGELLITPPFYGARYKRIESDYGIELFSQGDVFSRVPKGKIISRRTIKKLKDEISPKGATIIPAQGTLGENEIFGRAKFVWGYLEDKLLAGHLMRFIPNKKRISEGYLFTVLNSKLFFRILRNSVYGTNLLGFIVPMLNEIPIPRLPIEKELEIDANIKQAYMNFTKANEIEAKAIKLIETELDSWQN